MIMRIPRSIKQWLYTLVGTCISSGATSVATLGGFTIAKAAGANVPVLSLHDIWIVFLSGLIPHAFAFLAKSPLPPVSFDTQTITKSDVEDDKQ